MFQQKTLLGNAKTKQVHNARVYTLNKYLQQTKHNFTTNRLNYIYFLNLDYN